MRHLKKFWFIISLSIITTLSSILFGYQDCICTTYQGFPFPIYRESQACFKDDSPILLLGTLGNLMIYFLFGKRLLFFTKKLKQKMIPKLKQPFKLSLVSILITIFLHQSQSKCGGYSFGLPLKFIRTTCDCAEHIIPINFLNFGFDIVYHLVIWSFILYLWQDARETWAMMKQSFINNKSA